MKDYLAYIRVSTVKQEEHSSSLQEQRSAIEAYAQRNALTISDWVEETETAAKQGRRRFTRMLADLQQRRAKGVIIHKIDRSARNLKDWARLGDLIDAGVEVHFAHESLDLGSRGGRLAADIQAVVAADFIRNLRQEVRKGIKGRLKQGYFPRPAPRGYLNNGKGKPKTIDPVVGPLVRQAFELYASGAHTLDTLRAEMFARGLRSAAGTQLSLDAMSATLRNPFYIGIIYIKATGETFEGVHTPLVRKAIFDRVQAIMSGRAFARPQKHTFTFRRLIRCGACGYSLIGERRKGHAYYRCHSQTCRGTTLRERDVDRALKQQLAFLAFTDEEMRELCELAKARVEDLSAQRNQVRSGLRRDLAKCEQRLSRLTDAFLEGDIDKETFEARKRALFGERRALRDQLELSAQAEPFSEAVLKNLGRGNTAHLGYEQANPEEKREIAKALTSDLVADRKSLAITLRNEFQRVEKWRQSGSGAPRPGPPRKTASLSDTPSKTGAVAELFEDLCRLAEAEEGESKRAA